MNGFGNFFRIAAVGIIGNQDFRCGGRRLFVFFAQLGKGLVTAECQYGKMTVPNNKILFMFVSLCFKCFGYFFHPFADFNMLRTMFFTQSAADAGRSLAVRFGEIIVVQTLSIERFVRAFLFSALYKAK